MIDTVEGGSDYYLFIATLDETAEDDSGAGSWEGSVNKITRQHERSMDRLEQVVAKKVNAIDEQINQSAIRDAAQDKDLKKKVYHIMKGNKT